MALDPTSRPLFTTLFVALALLVGGCGGGSDAQSSKPPWVLLSLLFKTSARSKTFQENPPGDATGNYVETTPDPPSPCSPPGSVNLVATHILDRVEASGRHARLYLDVAVSSRLSIKGSWISTTGTSGDFLVFDPPITFPDLMSPNVPVQRTGRVLQQVGGPVPFAGSECNDLTGSTDIGAYDFVFTYLGLGSATVPAGTWVGSAHMLLRNEITPLQTRTVTSFFAGDLGEVYWEEAAKTGSLQFTGP